MSYVAVAIYSQVGAAVLFIGALVWLWVKVLQPMVLRAQDAHNEQVDELGRHRDDAKRALDALQGEIENARHDAQSIVERARLQVEREREEALAQARAAGERTLHGAQLEIVGARAAARAKLREGLLGRALALARGEAAQRVDETVNARLVRSFTDSLKHGGAN